MNTTPRIFSHRRAFKFLFMALLMGTSALCFAGKAAQAQNINPPQLPQCEGRSICPFAMMYQRWQADEVSHYCKFPLLVVNQTFMANPDACPDTQFYFYYPFADRHRYSGPFHEWNEVVNNHEDWFLHDVGFENDPAHRIYDTYWPQIHKMNVSNSEYRAYMKDRYRRLMDQDLPPGMAGIYEDGPFGFNDTSNYIVKRFSCHASRQPDGVDRCPSLFYNEAEYKNFYNPAYNDLQSSLPDITFITNSGLSLDHIDNGAPYGEGREHAWHFKGRNATQFYPFSEWKMHVDEFGRAENEGKIAWVFSGASKTSPGIPVQEWRNRMMEYSAASFLLSLNPNAARNLMSWHTVSFFEKPEYESRIYDFDIGSPVDSHYISSQPANDDPACMPWMRHGAHARDFTKGKVFVNPSSGCTYQVPLDRQYKDLDGKIIKGSVTLLPNTAKVLLVPQLGKKKTAVVYDPAPKNAGFLGRIVEFIMP